MFFQCLTLGFVRLSVYRLWKLSELLLMCLTFHIRVVHFFSMLKKVISKYLYFYKEIFLPNLPNLGAQIRCAKICILLSKQTWNTLGNHSHRLTELHVSLFYLVKLIFFKIFNEDNHMYELLNLKLLNFIQQIC